MSILMEILVRVGIAFLLSLIFSYSLWKILMCTKNNSPLKTRKITPPAYGGVAIFFAYWISYYMLNPFALSDKQGSLFIASLIILITGILDDWLNLSPLKKSVGILFACHYVYYFSEISFSSQLIDFQDPFIFNSLKYLLTILWIYLVTNALNLLDGIDGLASSVSLVSLFSMVIITLGFSLTIQLDFVLKLLFLFASIAGFLIFNWPPAKIMLGDTGALFIGFMYASLTVTNLKNASLYSFIFPILLFAVPLFDTTFAFMRRLLHRSPVTEGDKEHIHHRLLRRGYSESAVNKMMMALSAIFSIITLALHAYPELKWSIWGLTLVLIFIMICLTVYIGKESSHKK
ncbi:MraY family glycosyltransferase [Facklamia miroungae]|uniref:UDP-GlcNAc:undecaprenyl-phosphate GlcNAc-1-phosphate transferase n=1 Tax=Facklamia miroungae TaxID=120956 RepID=A0A1G7SHB5_9LACT|nr:MraY family glycosyltransferase [Facklamia miroungae]NKZ29652.1 undecaprenyl/decaprenyl-phosphate alpha-N-acetylglucosaminyl 1-phosphate transferase [Facklamia miroungae]SDG22378.1 UDP-GlcNAc:undecaprenyl-phosphate GlcNAc-1-phosphate transferase [Facklamia miroungae]